MGGNVEEKTTDVQAFAPPVQYVTRSFAILPLRWEGTDYEAAVTADMQRLVMLAYAMVNGGVDVPTIMARMMGVVE
jgi:hypothetical protein